MSNCVNLNSKEFKDCCSRLNVSATTLEPIIHEFINIEGNEKSFPSDVYIEERIHGSEQLVSSDEQVILWEKRYSQPAQFDDVLEALSYITEAERFFPRESIGLKETLDGKVEVNVARPYIENIFTKKGIIQKFRKSLFRGQGDKPAIDEDGNLILTATYDKLFNNYGKSFATSISEAYHYGEITSHNPYIIEVDSEYLDTIIPLNENARTTDKGVRAIGDEYGENEHEERLQYEGKILIPKGKYKISRHILDFSKIKTSALLDKAMDMFKVFNNADNIMFGGEYSRLTKGINSYSDVKDVFNEIEDRIGKEAASYVFALYSQLDSDSYVESIYDKRKDISDVYTDAIKKGFVEQAEESDYEYLSSRFFEWLKLQEEKQQIKKETISNGTFMKAPNGKPTNLTEDQWLSVRTKAFKRWFGDWENNPENASKVVDENGEPLVVYHHTDNPNLTKFSIDFDNYFSKDGGTKLAIFFDEEKTGTLNRKYDIPVFLNIRKLNEYNETKAQLHERGTTYREVVNQSAKTNPVDGGVHMKDFDDNMKEHQNIWIVHNPNQIKSAEFNIGYSEKEDTIYHGASQVEQTVQEEASNKLVYTRINAEFKDILLKHLKEDSFENYSSAVEKETLIKMANALFNFFERNEYRLIITTDKKSHGSFIRHYNKNIVIHYNDDKAQGNKYLNIIHELLHVATAQVSSWEHNSLDNELLESYYALFLKKLNEDPEYQKYARLMMNHYDSYEERDALVPLKYQILVHAASSTAEFISCCISNKEVKEVLESITTEDTNKSIWEEVVKWIKHLFEKIFKGNSFIKHQTFVENLIEFLQSVEYVPAQVRNPNIDQTVDFQREAEFNTLYAEAKEFTSKNTMGENISSKGSEFAKQLTNPGNTVSVTYKGTTFRNAEHAYQTWKSGEFDESAYKSKAFKPVGSKKVNKAVNFDIMVEILTAKLQQHPELIEGINERGGLDYILNSTHNVTGDKYWESSGENKFIEALAKAYENVIGSSGFDNKSASKTTATPVTKIISGGQTGVDTIGLQVAKELGIETGGKAPKGFLREKGYDTEDISSYGLEEITDEEQADYTSRKGKKDPYTGRTELNVRNSDGTVYFSTASDSSGKIATKRAADEWGKPFIENPTAEELRQWLIENNIKTLNVAGNRGSKLDNGEEIKSLLKEALSTKEGETLTQEEIDAKANKEAELDAIFQNALQLTEQLKNIQDSGLISTSEFTQLAMDVAYYISDLITRWQENPEDFKQSAPTLAAKIDVRTLSRRELVEKIGVPKLLEVVKKTLFGKRIPGVDARKTLLLFKNFDALIRFGSSAFNTVEDFQISYSEIGYTVSDKTQTDENENLTNEENAVIEETGDKQEHWQIDSRTVDTFLTMSQAVKKELARCYKLNADNSIKQNEFGINERISPRDATSCILRWTQGALSLSDMITKLEGKQENNPWIKPIIEKLKDTSGKYSDFQSQFFGVFCKHFQEYYIVKEFNEGGNRVLRIMPVNRTPALNEIMTSIEVLFKLKSHPMFNSQGLIKEKLDELKQYVNLLNDISQGEFNTLPLDRISKGIAKIADLLGYKTTDEMVILALTPESLYEIKRNLGFIIKNLEKGLGDSNYNPFAYSKEGSGIRGNLKEFLAPLTEILEDLAISSFFESGKMYQSYVIPSYMTKLMRKFHNSNEQEFKEFMQKEYGQYEWFRDQSRDIEDPNSWKNDWLKQLYFMEPEDRKKLFGHKVQLSFTGHNYMRNMSGPEYVMAIMTEFFSGSKDSKESIVPAWYKIPMMSNKPSLEFIKFARYRGVGWDETILDGLDMVFIQELGRIIEVRNRAYDKKDDRHIKNFDTNGRKFCFLDFLNDYLDKGGKANTELGILLNKKINSSESLTIEEENNLSDRVRKEIKAFMNKTSDRIIQSYKDSGLFEAVKKIDGIGSTDAEIESNLKNFIWNDTYASMMILQMTITDIAYYANAEDLQKRLAQIHAPGIRPNVEAMDYGEYDDVGKLIRKAKRVCDGNLRNIFLKDFEGDAVIQNIIENLEIVFDRKYNEAKTDAEREYWKATKESIIDAFKQVNVTDAQAYNSITSYRKKALMFGKWSTKCEEVYKKLKEGNWNISDLETIFQPLKPFVYTNSTKTSVGSKLKVGMQFKNAEYALLIADAILRNEDTGKPNLLRVLSEVMEESADRTENKDKGIDTIMFASAVKAGLHGRLDIANFASEKAAKDYLESKIYGDGADGYNETYVHTFPAEDYSIQQDYSPHFLEHSQADGSQKRMIIPSDLATEDANGNPVLYTFKDGDEIKSLTAEEFKKEYEKTYAENIESSLNELEFELGLNLPTKKLRNIALSQVLQKEILSSPRYGIDLYIACSVDSDGNFNIPLGDPIQSKRIEQLINSIVKNRLNKQKIKGGPVVQVSNFGSKRLNIKFKDKNGNILPTLTEWLEKNPGKTVEDFKKFLEDNQAGVAYYECYAPASMREIFECFMDENGFIDWEAINEVAPEMLEMLGFRIPTEDLYSIAPLRIMGFLPKEAGEALMLPYEITVIWGADYDWDKAYLQRKEFIIKMNSRRDIEDALIYKFGNKNKEGIKMFLDQAADPKTRMQAYGTYPEYAKFYRRVAFSVDKPTKGKAYRNNKIIDMSLAVLTHETSAHRMLNPGGFEPQKRMGYLVSAVKLGKGTYEQLSKMSTDDLKTLCMTDKNLSFIDINTQFYEQNNAAGSILGMFAVQKIAHATLENNQLYLDVNKALQLQKNTPFVFCGKRFYGLVEFDPTLNSQGEYIGKVLGSLVASAADAVKDPVLNLMNINSTTANVLTTMIRFGIPFEQAALLTSQKIIGDCLKEFNVRNLEGFVPFATILEEKLASLRDSLGITEGDQVSTEELTEKELIEGLVSDNPKLQYKALLAFSNFMTMANELKGPTFATRFNSISNAVGPQIIDNLIMANKMTQFSSNIRRKVGDTIVEININDIFNMHPILQQFAKGLDTANKIFGDHMPLLSQYFQQVLSHLPEGLENKIYGDRKLLSKLADFYLSYLLINSKCIDTTTSKGLEYYINQFPKEFFESKIKEKYPNNAFIQAIMVETTKTPDGSERFILKLNTTGMETTDKEKLSAGWEDLAKSGEEGFNLAMKLFKYCFYKGGIGFTPKTFMHLLPNSIKKLIPKYIESFRNQEILHPEYVIDQFIRNNWQNNKLAPRIKDAEDFVEFDEGLSFGIVDTEYHSQFKGLDYCKIKLNGKDTIFKVNRYQDKNKQLIIRLDKTTPLGNNGEYLEISLSDVKKTMDNTDVALADETNNSPEVMPETVENTLVTKTNKERQKYLDLIARVITQEKIDEFKAKSSDEQQLFKPSMKTFFTKAFAKRGIEFNMEEFDKLWETFCN